MKPCLFALAIAVLAACNGVTEVYDLRCEGLEAPLAIDSARPHFSWKIKSGSDAPQTAYRLQLASSRELLLEGTADIWDSGKVVSPDQVMVLYAGQPLSPRQICWWRVWSRQGGRGAWSEPARFGVGIIDGDSVAGEYIGAVPGEGRSAMLRRSVHADAAGTYIFHVNSLGYHELFINGTKVGDAVLTPAVSQLDKRSLIVSYDVSEYIREGDNDIVLMTSSGWYKPATFGASYEGALVKAELDLVTPSSSLCVLATDASWQGAWSGYRDPGSWRSWDFGGEVIDARSVPADMSAESLDALRWGPVDVVKPGGMCATQQMCELCRVQETVPALSLEACGENRWVADFGKVVNGMLQVRLPQLSEGNEVRVLFYDNKPDAPETCQCGENILISSGREGGDVFTGRFNSNVARYVVLENLPEKPLELSMSRMRTDYPVRGSFSCSDPDLQAIYDMVSYTLENLAFDGYMVDCASIERLGYGGDGNASALSFQTMADAAPLYLNWLQAWGDVMRPDGGLPHTAPSPYNAGGGPYWCSFIVQAPWRSWMSYGDPRLLERHYDDMKLWLGYVDAWSSDGLLRRWPDTGYRNWYLGDWLAPKGTDVSLQESVDLVNNCALSQSLADLEHIAELLGRPEDKAAFRSRLDALNARIHEVFFHPDSSFYGTGSQIDMIYPLLVGAVPDSCREAVEAKLLERCVKVYDGHLGVGLVGVPVLSEWATLSRNADLVYGMLKKRDYPGYLYMIDNGATGTWEEWGGDRSHMHNCYNGILSWYYQALGGIIPLEPGYRKVLIDPQMPEGLGSVSVTKETPYGPICVSWDNTGRKPRVEVSTPPGVEVSKVRR